MGKTLNNFKLDNFISGIISFLLFIHNIPYLITRLAPIAKITLISTTKNYILGTELASILLERGKR